MSINSRTPTLLTFKALFRDELAFPRIQVQPSSLPSNFLHGFDDAGPALEVACAIGVKGDDVAVTSDFLDGRCFLKDYGVVAFTMALYGCCEAGEACADD
jgi:hypothetical protein